LALSFIITRPGQEGLDLVKLLQEIHKEAEHLPIYNLIKKKLHHKLIINPDDEMFFFSKTSVSATLYNWPKIFFKYAKNRCWAIGPATAGSLEKAGAKNIMVPKSGPYNSEKLVSLLRSTKIKNTSRFMLFQQPEGVEMVVDYLKSIDAYVETHGVYEQERIVYSDNELDSCSVYTAVVVTSGQALMGLLEQQKYFNKKMLFVVGERLYKMAIDARVFHKVIALPEASNTKILKFIENYKDV
jgi:uroporphyrinogen-III synthase